MSNSVQPHRRQPTRLPRPWDSPGKNTGVGCHFLLQSMKVKSKSEVAQSCLTLHNPMYHSLPGSSILRIFQAGVLEWVTIAFPNYILILTYITSLLFSRSVVSDSLRPLGLKHTRFPCPSPSPRASSNSCPLSQWCHATILSSVIPSPPAFNLLALGSFLMSWLFVSGGQTIGASASILPMNIQDWFPLGLTGLISLQSKGLSRIFSNSTVQKHQFFYTQPSLWYHSCIHTWLLEKP